MPPSSPLVSVVVPVFNVEEYLAEAVASLTAQTHENLEILLVDDASTDGSLALARRLAQDDPRIVVVPVGHGGLGATRNRGLERARGTYVTFVDADDIVPPDAFAAMVASLEASGSAFVTGGVERFDATRAWIPGWVRAVHGRDLQATTLADLPEAMRDILACNRMYRRSFWDEHIGPFPEGMVYEDHVPMLRSYLHGTRFDVLAQVTYRWRRRDDGTSLSQPKDELANLADRARAKEDAWQMLQEEGTPTERALWLARVLDLDLVPYLTHAGTAEPEYQELLATTVATYVEAAAGTPEGRRELAHRVRGPQRLAAWYAAHRDWAALASLTAELAARRPPLARLDSTAPGGARAVVDDTARSVTAPPLPEWWAEVPFDIAPSLLLTRITWDDSHLRVRGTLRVPGLSVSPDDVDLDVAVGESPATHRARILGHTVRRADAPLTATELDVDVAVPHAALEAANANPADIAVEANLTLRATRTLPVALVAGTGTRSPRPRAELLGGTSVLPVITEDGLVLRHRRATAAVTALDLAADGLRIELQTGDASALSVTLGTGDGSVALTSDGNAWHVPTAMLAEVPHDAAIEVDLGSSSTRALAPTSLRSSLPRGLAASARGTLHVIPGPRARLIDVSAADDGIRLEHVQAGLADIPDGSSWHATLRDGESRRELAVSGDAPPIAHLDVPRAAPVDDIAPSVASVRLELHGPDGAIVPLRVDDRVLDAQPFMSPSGSYDVRVIARKDGIELRVEHLEPAG